MSDIEQRLREAHPNSQQHAGGSMILLEAADEIASLKQGLARQANLDVMMHFEDMRAAKERLESRCAELEDAVSTCAVVAKDGGWLDKSLHDQLAPALNGNGKAWLLRKQADAIDDWLHGEPEMGDLADYADRLRQQADELGRDG